jgi:hypothetical protein
VSDLESVRRAADPFLFGLALEASYDSEGILWEALSHPRWDDWHSKWESFVPCGLRDRWDNLSADMKLAVYVTASSAFSQNDPSN